MSELEAQSRNIRVVRILIVKRDNEYKSVIIAFVASDNPLPALTEEYLLAQPRIAALDIESILSFKEDQDVNATVTRRFTQIDESKEDMTKILDWIETLVRSIWTFHDSLPIKATHTEHDSMAIDAL